MSRRRPELLSRSNRDRALDEFAVRQGVAANPLLRANLDTAAGLVLEAFVRDGIDGLLMKGAALARLLYDVPEQRRYEDIDVLVAPGDLTRAQAALLELGYQNASELVAVDDIGGVLHGQTWLGEGGVVIDLHSRLAGSTADAQVCWEALRARSSTLDLAGSEVRVLDRAGSAMQLATHAAQHGQGYAKGARELSLALERWPVEVWTDAARLAEGIGATEAFAAGLRLVEPGAELAERLQLPATTGLDWELRQASRPRGQFHLHAFFQAASLRTRLHVLRRALFPHPRWIARQYPWTSDRRGGILAGYLLHIARSPAWALRALRYRVRQRRAAKPGQTPPPGSQTSRGPAKRGPE